MLDLVSIEEHWSDGDSATICALIDEGLSLRARLRSIQESLVGLVGFND